MVRKDGKVAKGGLRRLLTISQAAEFLNIHPNTLRSWTNTGALKSYRLGTRGDRRFAVEDLASFLEEHRVGSSNGVPARGSFS